MKSEFELVETESVSLDGTTYLCSRERCLQMCMLDVSTIRLQRHMIRCALNGIRAGQESKFKRYNGAHYLEKYLVGVACTVDRGMT